MVFSASVIIITLLYIIGLLAVIFSFCAHISIQNFAVSEQNGSGSHGENDPNNTTVSDLFRHLNWQCII